MYLMKPRQWHDGKLPSRKEELSFLQKKKKGGIYHKTTKTQHGTVEYPLFLVHFVFFGTL